MFGIKQIGSFSIINRETGKTLLETNGNVSIPDITYEPITEFNIDANKDFSIKSVGGTISGTLDYIDNSFINKLITPPKTNTFSMELTGNKEVKVQARKHRQKRINKKWLKKYGYRTIQVPFEVKFNKCMVNVKNNLDILADDNGKLLEVEFKSI